MSEKSRPSSAISRRKFLRTGALGAVVFASGAAWWPRAAAATKTASPGASGLFPLNQDWLFGGKFTEAAAAPQFDDAVFERVTLPHCVAALSWRKWEPSDWEGVWIYRRHFRPPASFAGQRVFLNFEGVMLGTAPVLNGHALPQQLGGYLPSRYEITGLLTGGDNVLAVAVDSRWSNVPPQGSPKGPKGVDYLEPGGIFRPVRLESVPPVFISDVFAKPVNVLDPGRRIEAVVTIDAGAVASEPLAVEIELRDGHRVIARARQELSIVKTGQIEAASTLSNLGNIAFWDVDKPRLYNVVATLLPAANRRMNAPCASGCARRAPRWTAFSSMAAASGFSVWTATRYILMWAGPCRRESCGATRRFSAANSTATSCAVPTIRNPPPSWMPATKLA